MSSEFDSFDVEAFIAELDRSLRSGEFAKATTNQSEIITQIDNRQEYYEKNFLTNHFPYLPTNPLREEVERLKSQFKIWKDSFSQQVPAEQAEIIEKISLESLAQRAELEFKQWQQVVGVATPGSPEELEAQRQADYWSRIEEITKAANDSSGNQPVA